MAKRKITLRCPTCRTIVQSADEDFPFCSERCKTIDLGKWASGAYKVSSPVEDQEGLEELANRSERDFDGDPERKRSS